MNLTVNEIMNTLPENASDEEIIEASDKLFDIALSAFWKDNKTFDEALNVLHKLYGMTHSLNTKIWIKDHIRILEY